MDAEYQKTKGEMLGSPAMCRPKQNQTRNKRCERYFGYGPEEDGQGPHRFASGAYRPVYDVGLGWGLMWLGWIWLGCGLGRVGLCDRIGFGRVCVGLVWGGGMWVGVHFCPCPPASSLGVLICRFEVSSTCPPAVCGSIGLFQSVSYSSPFAILSL